MGKWRLFGLAFLFLVVLVVVRDNFCILQQYHKLQDYLSQLVHKQMCRLYFQPFVAQIRLLYCIVIDYTVSTWLVRQSKRSRFILAYTCTNKSDTDRKDNMTHSSIKLSSDSKSRGEVSSETENQTLGFFFFFMVTSHFSRKWLSQQDCSTSLLITIKIHQQKKNCSGLKEWKQQSNTTDILAMP